MDRQFVELPLPERLFRYRITYTDDVDVEPGTPLSQARQDAILNQFLQNYDLRRCGPVPFQKLRMFHDGNRWVIEIEAEEIQR